MKEYLPQLYVEVAEDGIAKEFLYLGRIVLNELIFRFTILKFALVYNCLTYCNKSDLVEWIQTEYYVCATLEMTFVVIKGMNIVKIGPPRDDAKIFMVFLEVHWNVHVDRTYYVDYMVYIQVQEELAFIICWTVSGFSHIFPASFIN